MQYGVSYYPEHKTSKEMEQDIRLIIESGINTVRMGEFAWCRMEPREGEYQFKWLEEIVERFGNAGIRSIICTPTACPPVWLTTRHPEILYVDNRGVKRPFGGRRFYCYNQPIYREYSSKITREVVKCFGNNPYVAGFQIDNEPAQEASGRCHCEACSKKFSGWMRDKYKTIENYNTRSGNVFWGQEYDSFEEICPPVNTIETGALQSVPAYYENPTLRLDFERFCSESQIEYQNLQADILHAYTSYPVTTNATGLATNSINYYESTKSLDCYGFDYYPGLRNAAVDSFPYAFARDIKSGVPFWVMEFMSGGGHRLGGSGRLQPNPGALKQAVIQAYANGADMLLHFQYRTFPFGAEQLNYAIVDMDGIPRRRYYEMQETAALLKRLEPLQSAGFSNEVAICLDYDVYWAFQIKPVNDPEFKYMDEAGRIYHLLGDIGYNADVVSYDADFSKYKVLILPSALLTTHEMQEKLKGYVSNGGVLLATYLTSVKNEDNIGYTTSLPAGLTELFGVCVKEVEPVFDVNRNFISLSLDGVKTESRNGKWSDILSGCARALGTYQKDYLSDAMAASEYVYEGGRAIYLGTDLEDEAFKSLLGYLCESTGMKRNPVKSDDKIEVIHRSLDHEDIYYVFNFASKAVKVKLETVVYDFLEHRTCHDEILLKENGFAVLKATQGL